MEEQDILSRMNILEEQDHPQTNKADPPDFSSQTVIQGNKQ